MTEEPVISCCDEHLEAITELVLGKKGEPTYYCPRCGKFQWPALHDGIRSYDEKLIPGNNYWNKFGIVEERR